MAPFCPMCGLDVSRVLENARARKASKRVNQRYIERVQRLLDRVESDFQDPAVQSSGPLWRQDVLAIRYVFNCLLGSVADDRST